MTKVKQEIEWPWQYHFPPFFTLQPHLETRQKQLIAWKGLILDYCKKNKVCTIDIREIADIPLFNNSQINRTLDGNALIIIMDELCNSGNAAALDKRNKRYEIYWCTLREFGSLMYEFVRSNNNLNTVLTLFELIEGELVENEPFYKLNADICIKSLRLLEQEGKCELIIFDDNQGVKFY